MPEARSPRPGFADRWFPNAEWVLLFVLGTEIGIFGVTGDHFLTAANAFEIVRLAAEVGLLALGLTPVIKTGGIDLSVGSMMGLAAVVLGGAWSALGLRRCAVAALPHPRRGRWPGGPCMTSSSRAPARARRSL